MTDPPWEPPRSGTETEHLVGALDRQRATFRWKADGLDAAGLATRLGASTLTLGGLLHHLAAVEDHGSTVKLTGEPMGGPWPGLGWDGSNDWELARAADTDPATLYARYDEAVGRARALWTAVLAERGLDAPIGLPVTDGRPFSVRRLLVDLVEEYARHTGHADLLREAVDGRVGEDPPPDWRP